MWWSMIRLDLLLLLFLMLLQLTNSIAEGMVVGGCSTCGQSDHPNRSKSPLWNRKDSRSSLTHRSLETVSVPAPTSQESMRIPSAPTVDPPTSKPPAAPPPQLDADFNASASSSSPEIPPVADQTPPSPVSMNRPSTPPSSVTAVDVPSPSSATASSMLSSAPSPSNSLAPVPPLPSPPSFPTPLQSFGPPPPLSVSPVPPLPKPPPPISSPPSLPDLSPPPAKSSEPKSLSSTPPAPALVPPLPSFQPVPPLPSPPQPSLSSPPPSLLPSPPVLPSSSPPSPLSLSSSPPPLPSALVRSPPPSPLPSFSPPSPLPSSSPLPSFSPPSPLPSAPPVSNPQAPPPLPSALPSINSPPPSPLPSAPPIPSFSPPLPLPSTPPVSSSPPVSFPPLPSLSPPSVLPSRPPLPSVSTPLSAPPLPSFSPPEASPSLADSPSSHLQFPISPPPISVSVPSPSSVHSTPPPSPSTVRTAPAPAASNAKAPVAASTPLALPPFTAKPSTEPPSSTSASQPSSPPETSKTPSLTPSQSAPFVQPPTSSVSPPLPPLAPRSSQSPVQVSSPGLAPQAARSNPTTPATSPLPSAAPPALRRISPAAAPPSEKISPVPSLAVAPSQGNAPAPTLPASPGPSTGIHNASSTPGVRAPSPAAAATATPESVPSLTPASSPTRTRLAQPPAMVFPAPPNAGCDVPCTDPSVTTLPGTPCACVIPMRVGLELEIRISTFLALVSELAKDLAAGTSLQQRQVQIVGANAVGDDFGSTEVKVGIVPLGNSFDNETAVGIADRFWQHEVPIDEALFVNYTVLYVLYPGLPPYSSQNVIGSNKIPPRDPEKPLGVDISANGRGRKLHPGIIAILSLTSVLAAILCLVLAWLVVARRYRQRYRGRAQLTEAALESPATKRSTTLLSNSSRTSTVSLPSSFVPYTGSVRTFTLSEMTKATDSFNPSNVIGEGGFGRVYRGVLEDQTNIAVKVLIREDQQGDREFAAEVEMLSRLHHRNLVKLVGICTEDDMRCLVYELIPNGSVESHLHGDDKRSSPLSWEARLKIALGAARALAYLHEDSYPRVIHRDFKSSNILLERDFTPKVSDFGLAKAASEELTGHISTRVMGTFGYVAPEYAMTGHLLVKSDVYSYGVVLLELLSGRKPVDMSRQQGQENLVTWARPLLTSTEGLEILVDPELLSSVPMESLARVAAIASMCVQPEVSQRPFMGEVVQALKLVCSEHIVDVDSADEPGTSSAAAAEAYEARYKEVWDMIISRYKSSNSDTDSDGRPLSASSALLRQVSPSFGRHSAPEPMKTGIFDKKRNRNSGKHPPAGSVSEHGLDRFREAPMWP